MPFPLEHFGTLVLFIWRLFLSFWVVYLSHHLGLNITSSDRPPLASYLKIRSSLLFLVFWLFLFSYLNCFTLCHAQQLAQSYSGSAAIFVWVNENAVIASENGFGYLEQLCPVDFVWWWKWFIFVLSSRAAPPICGSWALGMWQVQLKN